jgi:hypothetical protein
MSTPENLLAILDDFDSVVLDEARLMKICEGLNQKPSKAASFYVPELKNELRGCIPQIVETLSRCGRYPETIEQLIMEVKALENDPSQPKPSAEESNCTSALPPPADSQ